MEGYLISETDNKGWNKPLKFFKDKNKALDYANKKQKISDDYNLGFNYRLDIIDIE